jgi:hypothetical protein
MTRRTKKNRQKKGLKNHVKQLIFLIVLHDNIVLIVSHDFFVFCH